jgi:arylsulfatase A-like enzyme
MARVKHGLALLSLLLLDRLASEVVRFNRAYAPGFFCIPSRTLFMLGLNNRPFGADHFKRQTETMTNGVYDASKKTQLSFTQL